MNRVGKSKAQLKREWDEANAKSFDLGLQLFDIDEGKLRKYHTGKTLAYCLSYGASLEKAISTAFKDKKFNNFDVKNLSIKIRADKNLLNRYDRLLALALSGNEHAVDLELKFLNEESLKRNVEKAVVLYGTSSRDTVKIKSRRESALAKVEGVVNNIKLLFK